MSRILLDGGKAGADVPLAPRITHVSPADGSGLRRGHVILRARIADAVSGVDPRRVVVEVDGRRVAHGFGPRTGRLSASLRLSRGAHNLWIRAFDHAEAPAHAAVHVTVR